MSVKGTSLPLAPRLLQARKGVGATSPIGAARPSRQSAMAIVHGAFVVLLLYGDLVKRLLPQLASLVLLYGAALTVLVALSLLGRRQRRSVRLPRSGQLVNLSARLLVVLYFLQLLSSIILGAPLRHALVHAVYVSVPLTYIVATQQLCPRFDLAAIARIFLWLVLPANVVGFVQYFLDPAFLTSTAYSPDAGIIARNLMREGVFLRYPSLFVSADRYSAVGLIQLYLAVFLLLTLRAWSWRRLAWIGLNCAFGVGALLIAGARSRILIALVALGLSGIAFVVGRPASSDSRPLRLVRKAALVASILFLAALGVWRAFSEPLAFDEARVPVVGFFRESWQQGDIEQRMQEAAVSSAVPDTPSILGSGLGTEGVAGKPGEFGVRSIWLESGLFWGLFLLLGFGMIVLVLLRLTLVAAFRGGPVEVFVFSVPLLLLVYALLAGLTAAFELSSGLYLGCAIGVITRSSSLSASWATDLVVSSSGPAATATAQEVKERM